MGRYLDQLTADIKTAMKAREKDRLNVLRMVVASIKSEMDAKGGEALDDEAEMAILLHAVKTRRDSVQQAQAAGRQEIADAEAAEIEIVQAYLPEQLTPEELEAKVREVAAEVGYASPRDTGRFMQVWMARYKGKADGKAVQAALKALG